jgi:hypothetical protein
MNPYEAMASLDKAAIEAMGMNEGQLRMLKVNAKEYEELRNHSALIRHHWHNKGLSRYLLGDKVPDWTGTNWIIDHFYVDSMGGFLREGFQGRYIETDTRYTRLKYRASMLPDEGPPDYIADALGGKTPDFLPMMTDTPSEIYDHYLPQMIARKIFAKNVLIFGLGLGIVVDMMLDVPSVQRIVVIEKDPEIFMYCQKRFEGDKRLTFVCQDALTMPWFGMGGDIFDVVWCDIWPTISEDNVKDITLLHRRWTQHCRWIGSWGHDRLKYERMKRRRWQGVAKRWGEKEKARTSSSKAST